MSETEQTEQKPAPPAPQPPAPAPVIPAEVDAKMQAAAEGLGLSKADVMEIAVAGARGLVNELDLKGLKPSVQALEDAKAISQEISPTIAIAKLQALTEDCDKLLKDIGGYTVQVANLEEKMRLVGVYLAIINERVKAVYETADLSGEAEVGGRKTRLTSEQVHSMVDKKIEFLKAQLTKSNLTPSGDQ